MLKQPQELTMPDSRWTRYGISPISTALCPPDGERGITSDMVAPIAPNTFPGRRSVRPTAPFPFSNCYHWIQNETFVRVKARPQKFDYSRAVRLTTDEHVELSMSFTEDCIRITEHLRRKHEEAVATANAAHVSDMNESESESESDSDSDSWHSSGQRSGSQTGRSDSFNTMDLASLLKEDVFGWEPDPNISLIPLVDLWFELDEHLTPDSIPSPLELCEEGKTIQSYVFRFVYPMIVALSHGTFYLVQNHPARM